MHGSKLKTQNYVIYLHIDMPQKVSEKKYPPVKDIFGVELPPGGLFAEWFTGQLVEPFDELDKYDFEKFIRLYIFQNGKLISTKEMKTEEYYEYLGNLRKTK